MQIRIVKYNTIPPASLLIYSSPNTLTKPLKKEMMTLLKSLTRCIVLSHSEN